MAIQAKLTIKGDSKEYNILECVYDFRQSIDDTGKPTSRPEGGIITFVTPSTSDDDLFFYKWMFNKIETQSGVFRFTVYSDNNEAIYKTLEFVDAYCIEVKDYFNNTDSKLMYSTITISAKKLRFGAPVKPREVVERSNFIVRNGKPVKQTESADIVTEEAIFTNEWT